MRNGDHYVRLPYPWKAIVDVSSPAARSFFASLVAQALRYGMPSRRRLGPLQAAVARRGLPKAVVETWVRAHPRRPADDVASLRRELASGLSDMTGRTVEIGGLVVLERAVARTVFLFESVATPAYVAKIPRGSDETLEREAAALTLAAPIGMAPRFVGRVAGAWVQEGLPGDPIWIEPLQPDRAHALPWPATLEKLASRLIHLATETARDGTPDRPMRPFLEAAAAHPELSRVARSRIEEASNVIDRIGRVVLKHSDTSPQNCLIGADGSMGLIDWEMAELAGAPAFDVYNAAMSYFEHGIALVRWREGEVVDSFERAWHDSPYFASARDAARDAARAAGLDDGATGALEIAFFARRLARRLDRPDAYATGVDAATRMIEVVCAS